MKKFTLKEYYIILTSFIFITTSCGNEINLSDVKESRKSHEYEAKVLYERENNYPLIISQNINDLETVKSSHSDNSPLFYHLGSGFAFNDIPLSNTKNVLPSVIDIDKYIEKEKIKLEKIENTINDTKVEQTVFYTFNEYIRKRSLENKIGTGGEFNFLKIINAESKTELNTVFKKDTDIKDEQILGEYTAEYQGSLYSLLYTDQDTYDKISVKYLDENFIKRIYNTSPQEFFENFGSFTIFKFISGALARAYYSAVSKEKIEETTKEIAFNNSMKASVSIGDKIGGGINFKYESNNNFYKKDVEKFSSINISLKTVGGNSGIAQYTPTVDIRNVNINLSTWAASLDNKANHVLIDIPDKGLVTTSSLILEDNFKKNIESFNNGWEKSYDINRYKLEEPYIYITTHEENQEGTDEEGEVDFYIKAFLITRHGNRVALYTTKKHLRKEILFPYEPNYRYSSDYPSEKELSELITECKDYVKAKYGLKVIYSPINKAGNSWGTNKIHSYEDLDFDFNYCKKYYNPDLKITYWLFNKNERKYGLAIADNYILNTYAFKNTPTQVINDIDYRELSKYLIIGL